MKIQDIFSKHKRLEFTVQEQKTGFKNSFFLGGGS